MGRSIVLHTGNGARDLFGLRNGFHQCPAVGLRERLRHFHRSDPGDFSAIGVSNVYRIPSPGLTDGFHRGGRTPATTSRRNAPERKASYRNSPAWIGPKPNPTKVRFPLNGIIHFRSHPSIRAHSSPSRQLRTEFPLCDDEGKRRLFHRSPATQSWK